MTHWNGASFSHQLCGATTSFQWRTDQLACFPSCQIRQAYQHGERRAEESVSNVSKVKISQKFDKQFWSKSRDWNTATVWAASIVVTTLISGQHTLRYIYLIHDKCAKVDHFTNLRDHIATVHNSPTKRYNPIEWVFEKGVPNFWTTECDHAKLTTHEGARKHLS